MPAHVLAALFAYGKFELGSGRLARAVTLERQFDAVLFFRAFRSLREVKRERGKLSPNQRMRRF